MKPTQFIDFADPLLSNQNTQTISVENSCPDAALIALERMNYPYIFNIFTWIIILLSFEQGIHVFTLFIKNYNKLNFNLKIRSFEFQTGLGLLWTLFTASSHILVVTTSRSNAAVLTKGLHVITEAIFLIQISISFNFFLFASVCCVVIFIIFILILSLPCKATITPASYSGILLDSINFIAHLIYAISVPRNKILLKVVFAFGFHLLYLILFVLVENNIDYQFSDEYVASFRLIGAYSNYIAGELFINVCYNTFYTTKSGWIQTKEWIKDHKIVNVWRNDELLIIGDTDTYEQPLNIFEPYKTGFDGFSYAFINTYLPIFGTSWVSTENNRYSLITSIFCSYRNAMYVSKSTNTSNMILVLNWYMYRFPLILICLIVGIILTSI